MKGTVDTINKTYQLLSKPSQQANDSFSQVGDCAHYPPGQTRAILTGDALHVTTTVSAHEPKFELHPTQVTQHSLPDPLSQTYNCRLFRLRVKSRELEI